MSYQDILFEANDGVALITLNRPHAMNTWTSVMAAELQHAMQRCDEEDDIHAVVITGQGDRAFCAGADLSRGGDTFDGGEREQPAEEILAAKRLLPHQISKPVIAAINGHAVGVGMTYPMLADIRIVAENAKIAFPFVKRGVMPELASHITIAAVAGLSNAAELLLTGRTILGSEAAAMGLASRALPQQEVLPAAMEIAAEIATNAAPMSVAVTKRFLWEGVDCSVDEMMNKENSVFGWMGKQSDAKEGVMSFVEKRPPNWEMGARDIPEDLFNKPG
jgi:enoyl-CoA hydratase/carnithine racemase